jgi:hypothetical protein
MHYSTIEETCRRLQEHAIVEILDFDGALRRVRNLLGLDRSALAELECSRRASLEAPDTSIV